MIKAPRFLAQIEAVSFFITDRFLKPVSYKKDIADSWKLLQKKFRLLCKFLAMTIVHKKTANLTKSGFYLICNSISFFVKEMIF